MKRSRPRRGSLQSFGAQSLQTHRHRHTIRQSAAVQGLHFPSMLEARGRTWGKGPPRCLLGCVVYLHRHLHSPSRNWVKGRRLEGRICLLPRSLALKLPGSGRLNFSVVESVPLITSPGLSVGGLPFIYPLRTPQDLGLSVCL